MAKFTRRHLSRTVLGAIVAVLAGITLVVVLVVAPAIRRGPAAETAASVPATPPVPAGYFKPTDEDWENLTFTRVEPAPFPDVDETEGTIAPADDTTTQVFSPYTGRVTAVYPTVGDTVRAGEPLFAVEGAEYAQAQNDLSAAVETLRAARVQAQVTAVNRAHLLALERLGGAASKDVEQSAADLATTQTAVKNDEVAVGLVRSRLQQLGLTGVEIDRLANAKAGSTTLGSSVIVTAPIDGTITQRGVGVGQQVDSAANGSSDVLFTITDLSRVFFVADVSETSIANVHVGDPISVRLLAFPGRTFDARVKYIAPALDPVTHRIAVRAEIDSGDGDLKPGMFGEMRIAYARPAPKLSVPEEAVIFEDDTARVWITGPNKTLALRYVHAGKTVDGNVEVISGLQPGDHVVTSGAIFIDRALRGGD